MSHIHSQFNHLPGTMEDACVDITALMNLIGSTETDVPASDTESFIVSEEMDHTMDLTESDIVMAFGCESPSKEPATIRPSGPLYYVDNARTHTSRGFNLLLAISTFIVYRDRSLLQRFCRDVSLENMIISIATGNKGFLKTSVPTGGTGEFTEVTIRRSLLVRLFRYHRNDSGSELLSKMFLGESTSSRSGANVRKIWGSLKRDIDRASTGGARWSRGFIENIGYRKVSARNCEFFLVFPTAICRI